MAVAVRLRDRSSVTLVDRLALFPSDNDSDWEGVSKMERDRDASIDDEMDCDSELSFESDHVTRFVTLNVADGDNRKLGVAVMRSEREPVFSKDGEVEGSQERDSDTLSDGEQLGCLDGVSTTLMLRDISRLMELVEESDVDGIELSERDSVGTYGRTR